MTMPFTKDQAVTAGCDSLQKAVHELYKIAENYNLQVFSKNKNYGI